MNIVGEKVLLRAIEMADKDILLSIVNDSETEHSLGGWSFPISGINQEDWIRTLKPNEKVLRCMISEREDGMTVGTAILSNIDFKNGSSEIHIKLINNARGKGYGSDTINTLLNYAFYELRLNCVYAHINSYNIASQKLFERCNFIKEGILRNRIYKKGEYHDVISYSLIREEKNGNRK